jgi:hypothetical protein
MICSPLLITKLGILKMTAVFCDTVLRIFNAEAQRTQRFTEEIALLSEAQVPREEEAIKEKKEDFLHTCSYFFFFNGFFFS